MTTTLHITSGDCAGESLVKSGLPGEIFVWHDILYDGPRKPGWPDSKTLTARAEFLEGVTGGGMTSGHILTTLGEQYRKIAAAADYQHIVLWFDGCLFDQSMLAHLLVLLKDLGVKNVELLEVIGFPGIDPFDGLGQLQPGQLASLYGQRRLVTDKQYLYAEIVELAFVHQDLSKLSELSKDATAPLIHVPAAAARWLREQPDPVSGLGQLEQLALAAITLGIENPVDIFRNVAENDIHPLYWGDITLSAKINNLADRIPPLIKIEGPRDRLPQWQSDLDLNTFCIKALSSGR